MSIGYTLGIPASANNPSTDQPLMQLNNDAVSAIVAIDHITFNASGADVSGQHKFVQFNDNAAPGAKADPKSILYTTAGTATTSPYVKFRNSKGIFPISAVRAFALCDSAGALLNSINVTSVTNPAVGQYVVTLVSDAVSSANFAVNVSSTMTNTFSVGVITGYNVLGWAAGVGTFQINLRSLTGNTGAAPTTISFTVYQI